MKYVALSLILIFGLADATEMKPWLGNLYEFEFRPFLIYQGYSHLSTGSSSEKYSSNDLFLNLSLTNSVELFGLEAEILGAKTRHQKYDVDQIKLTGRAILQDDISGDPIGLIAGLSFIQAFRPSVYDVSSFHHGFSEAEIFLSVGKENSLGMDWISRWWAIFALGTAADRGSPWIRFDLAYEKVFGEKQEIRLFCNTLWGTGNKRLHLCDFEGYGPIQHQSVDLGFRYTYLIDYFGTASLEYSYRVHARNFPEYTHRVIAQVLYTFGL